MSWRYWLGQVCAVGGAYVLGWRIGWASGVRRCAEFVAKENRRDRQVIPVFRVLLNDGPEDTENVDPWVQDELDRMD